MLRLLGLTLISLSALAHECPWNRGVDLLKMDKARTFSVRGLTSTQVAEDLACLNIILDKNYLAPELYPDNKLYEKLGAIEAIAMKNTELLSKIFAAHVNVPDFHLKYTVAGIVKRHRRAVSDKVVLKGGNIGTGQIIKRKNYTYFRPGPLSGELTSVQQQFVDYVYKNDVNLVLDLRGNPGGETLLALLLAEVLFTADEHIPTADQKELISDFKMLGYLTSIKQAGYKSDSVDSWMKSVLSNHQFKSIEQLNQPKFSVDKEQMIGFRQTPYTKKMVLIIDGGCASACETIVEKLSYHPHVKLVGAATAGLLHFANSMTFMLPHSGIEAYIPSTLYQYENDAPEGVGYAPQSTSKVIDLTTLF